jgi:hypothetical protein
MKDQAAVFILRRIPDLDNITPIIYKLSINTDINIEVVLTSSELSLTDYRIQFIDQQDNVNLNNILDIGKSEGTNIASKKTIDKIKTYGENIPTEIPAKVWNAFVPSETSSPYPSTDSFFQEFDNYTQLAIFFDWPPSLEKSHGKFLQRLINYSKGKGIPTVALPHGDTGTLTYMNNNNIFERFDYDIYKLTKTNIIQSVERPQGYDYYVAPGKTRANKEKRRTNQESIKILGSPRYNPEWIEINSKISPIYQNSYEDLYNVLLFLPKPGMSIYWEEMHRIITLLDNINEVNLVLKGHPRHTYGNIKKMIKKDGHTARIENDIHSVSLLNWSDMVISVGSSIDFSAIVRDLPLIELEYISATRSTVSHYINSCEIKSRDEMCETVRSLLDGSQTQTYSDKDRHQFINEHIVGPSDDVLQGYVNFILGEFDEEGHTN